MLDVPTRLLNCDETGMPRNPKPLKSVFKLDTKDPSCTTSNLDVQVSVLDCSSAAGYAHPPYMVFDTKP